MGALFSHGSEMLTAKDLYELPLLRQALSKLQLNPNINPKEVSLVEFHRLLKRLGFTK